MARTRSNPGRAPSKRMPYAVLSPSFIPRVRETEYVREMETRLELESLVTDDPAYHPLGGARLTAPASLW